MVLLPAQTFLLVSHMHTENVCIPFSFMDAGEKPRDARTNIDGFRDCKVCMICLVHIHARVIVCCPFVIPGEPMHTQWRYSAPDKSMWQICLNKRQNNDKRPLWCEVNLLMNWGGCSVCTLGTHGWRRTRPGCFCVLVMGHTESWVRLITNDICNLDTRDNCPFNANTRWVSISSRSVRRDWTGSCGLKSKDC